MTNKTAEIRSMVSLFKSIPMGAFKRDAYMVSAYECLRHGFVFITAGNTVIEEVPNLFFQLVDELYGTDNVAFNNTFHKSFKGVAEMSEEKYFMEQILHYFSTYGAELMGLKPVTYIPVEELDLPDVEFNISQITVITARELYVIEEMIDKFVSNTVAPSKRMIEDIRPLLDYISIPTDNIASFEIQVMKHDKDGTMPTNVVSGLRYLIYKLTGSTLIIKSYRTVETLKRANPDTTVCYDILRRYSPQRWATIFFRYKPLFLAMKHHKDCGPIINHIRRLANDYHVPLDNMCLQNALNIYVEADLRNDNDTMDKVSEMVEKASNRELVKLCEAGAYKLSTMSGAPSVFAIRNGRNYVKEGTKNGNLQSARSVLNFMSMCSDFLVERLTDKLEGRTFIIPDYIEYAVPVTEKQFIGNIPWGSFVYSPDGAFTSGIHWFNTKESRVDLDLHLNSATQHFGWNGNYKDGSKIVYSGDMTDAPRPNGAAEAFYFTPQKDDPFIMTVSKFCGTGKDGIPFKFFMSQEPVKTYRENYTFKSPVFEPIPLKFPNGDAHEQTIGMFANDKFFLYGGSLNDGIVPKGNYGLYINAILNKLTNQWTMRELLNECGAKIYDSLSEYIRIEGEDAPTEDVIDLTPSALTATSILDIVDGNI